MNVLFIINSFSLGGAEKLVYNLARRMHDPQISISIVGLYKTNLPIEKEMCGTLDNCGIKTYILEKRAKKDRLKSVWRIYNIIKQDKISVVHAHCGVPMLLGKLAGFFARVPVVCTVHSTRGYSIYQEQLTSWMSKAYISIGQAAERYMVEKLHIPSKKVTRIYNAIEISCFESRNKKRDFWSAFGGKTGDINLLHIGRVHEVKNQRCMLSAMAELKAQGLTQYKLYLVGPYNTKDPLYQQLNQFVEKNQLSGLVHFLGPQTDITEFLINADCFVMTSFYEGFSLAFLEAVISGLPVISTNLAFAHNLNQIASCCLIIPQNDNHALAETLKNKQFLTMTPPSELFAKKFSMENCVREHLELYKRIIK